MKSKQYLFFDSKVFSGRKQHILVQNNVCHCIPTVSFLAQIARNCYIKYPFAFRDDTINYMWSVGT
jgi:hypothetical protein